MPCNRGPNCEHCALRRGGSRAHAPACSDSADKTGTAAWRATWHDPCICRGLITTRTKGDSTMSAGVRSFSRRTLLKGLGAAGATTALGPVASLAAFGQSKLVVGVVYVGPRGDYGYNQAQAQAAAALKKMPGITAVEQEKVPETSDVQKVMASMIEEDGA